MTGGSERWAEDRDELQERGCSFPIVLLHWALPCQPASAVACRSVGDNGISLFDAAVNEKNALDGAAIDEHLGET